MFVQFEEESVCNIIYWQPIKSANDKEAKRVWPVCGWHARHEPGVRFMWPLVTASVAKGGELYFIPFSIKKRRNIIFATYGSNQRSTFYVVYLNEEIRTQLRTPVKS